ncbi:MAG TPA: putative O-glycosylation ligase, exosortase A system-associated [Rhodocyclaceae bacterium]|nr:putative O-glycosylation ligase, exosortase A system-associated [Rhodocyclaceae bacterium]
MRDLVILAMMFVFVPLALSNACAAYLLWGWTAVVALNLYVFGFMREVPFNLIFAVIAITLIGLGFDRKGRRFALSRTAVLLILFALQATISAAFAYEGTVRNVELYTNLLKMIFFCLLMPMVITNRLRVHALVLAIALGMGFHSLSEGLKFFASGGAHHVQGVEKFGDNNHFALAVTMIIPLLLYLYRYSQNRLVRFASLSVAVVTVAAVVGTHSRGGFMCMSLMGAWMALHSRRKGLAMVGLALGVVLTIAMAPSSWSERMNTIKEVKDDTSFMVRVVAWKASSQMALARPLTGGGFHAIQNQYVWDMYRESNGLLGFVPTDYRPQVAFAAHSIYFEVLGDMGFVGLFIFLAILANVFLTRRRILRLCSAHGGRLKWATDLSNMLAAAVLAYIIGAAALSLAYFEVLYIYAMLMEVLAMQVSRIALSPVNDIEAQPMAGAY